MRFFISIILLAGLLQGCAVLEVTGETAGIVGKVGWGATKTVGKAVFTGTSMAGQTANQANKTLTRSSGPLHVKARALLSGEQAVIPLEKEGPSFYVRVKLNNDLWGRFLVDTGASVMQISKTMAARLKVKIERGRTVPVTLAGGVIVPGRPVILKKVQLGAAAVENVRAIVLENDNMALRDGLLGMSFLENFIFSIDAQKQELILKKR
jgi:clan AA aspartic protease (TIGR02281 family)